MVSGYNGMNGRLALLPVAVENEHNIGRVHIPHDKTSSHHVLDQIYTLVLVIFSNVPVSGYASTNSLEVTNWLKVSTVNVVIFRLTYTTPIVFMHYPMYTYIYLTHHPMKGSCVIWRHFDNLKRLSQSKKYSLIALYVLSKSSYNNNHRLFKHAIKYNFIIIRVLLGRWSVVRLRIVHIV